MAIGLAICAAFVASAITVALERDASSVIQLFGAGFLIVVVLAHVAEEFDFFPSMGWGLPDSTGHYLDLVSAIAGLKLLPTGYLLRTASARDRRDGRPSATPRISRISLPAS